MGLHHDAYAELRDLMRWRVAVVLAALIALLMVALGTLNTRLGLPDTALLAWVVPGVCPASLALLRLLPRRLGGAVFFAAIAVLLLVVPMFGLQHNRGMQHWAYVFPPVVVFLLRPSPALVAVAAYGIWACAIFALPMAPIEVVRFGAGYGLPACFVFTYALLRYHSDHDALTNHLSRRTVDEGWNATSRVPLRYRAAPYCWPTSTTSIRSTTATATGSATA